MPERWGLVVKLIIAVLVLVVVALAFGTNRGMSLDERQRIMDRAQIKFQMLCLDPKDPLVSESDINLIRTRMGLGALPVETLRRVRERMGIPDAPQ